MVDKVGFQFGTPEHGWMTVRVFDSQKEAVIDASDVPCNSLELLINAMIKLLEGSESEEIEWSLEPAYEVWLFEWKESTIRLTITHGGGQPPTVFEDRHARMIRSVFKGLRDLECLPVWKSKGALSRVWSWRFPNHLSVVKQMLRRLEQA